MDSSGQEKKTVAPAPSEIAQNLKVAVSYEDKLDALQNEFKISVSKEMSEEVQSMCNLSMGILNKGEMKRAKETAYELRDMGLPDEKIARAVKVSMDILQEWFAEREAALVK